MDFSDDLALGDGLAAADDAPVARVLRDECRLRFPVKVAEDGAGRADGVPIRFGAQVLAGIFQQCDNLFGDSRGGSERRGFHPAQVDEARYAFRNLDDEVLMVRHFTVQTRRIAAGTQPRKCGDHVALAEARHELLRTLPDFAHPLGGDVDIGLVVDFLGVGADQRVAVQRCGDENALADLTWYGEKHVVNLDFVAIHHVIFTPPWRDAKLWAHPGFVHHLVGVEAGGVDDPAGVKVTVVRSYPDNSGGRVVRW